MSPNLTHAHGAAKAERSQMTSRAECTHVQCSNSQGCTNAPLDGVIGSYSIDPGYTIAGIVVAIAGAFFSIGCVIGIGICKTLGAK